MLFIITCEQDITIKHLPSEIELRKLLNYLNWISYSLGM